MIRLTPRLYYAVHITLVLCTWGFVGCLSILVNDIREQLVLAHYSRQAEYVLAFAIGLSTLFSSIAFYVQSIWFTLGRKHRIDPSTP